jgi:DNA replication protein DnaC
VIALGNSGTGKTHVALGLGLAACQKGLSVGFTTAAALVHELLEARDEKRLLRLQKQLTGYRNYPRLVLGGSGVQASTVFRMVLRGDVLEASRAVSTTVRMAASPSAAHIAR